MENLNRSIKLRKPAALMVVLILLVQGCIPAGTLTPAPATLPPAATPTQPPAAPTETTVPTAPAQPTAADTTAFDPPEAILFQQPGPGSRVVSPVRVAGMADPTFEQSLSVTILSAGGEALATTFAQIGADVGQRGPFSVDVPFSVSEEQQGFIQVYASSARDGGVTHLASVGVTLLPGGSAAIQPAAEHPEQIILLQPAPGATISGGIVHIEGYGLASFEQTLLAEVLDESGAVIASAPVTVAAPELGQPGPFSVDLPYSVSAASAGRVQVRDVSPAHGGSTHQTSAEVRLDP